MDKKDLHKELLALIAPKEITDNFIFIDITGAFNGDIRLIANYRNQWSSISTPFKTFGFSYDMGLMKKRSKSGFLGLGISFISDKAGSSQLGLNEVDLSLAYHSHISEHSTLSAGIMGGFAQSSINFNNLQWNSQYNGNNFDPSLPSLETAYTQSKSYADFGAGLQWTYTKGEMYSTANNQFFMNAGVAAFHVNQPNVSFYSSEKDNLPIKIVMHGSLQFGIKNSNMSVLPSFIYTQQGSQKDIIAGAMIRYKLIEESRYTDFIKGAAFSLGGLYRVGDAFIPCLQLEFANYAIGLSYDSNISKLSNATSGKGGLEISLKFINPNPFIGATATKSPRFFN